MADDSNKRAKDNIPPSRIHLAWEPKATASSHLYKLREFLIAYAEVTDQFRFHIAVGVLRDEPGSTPEYYIGAKDSLETLRKLMVDKNPNAVLDLWDICRLEKSEGTHHFDHGYGHGNIHGGD